MNANRGYIGWSMSRRAAEAYTEGKMPKTAFKKHYKISEKVFNYLKDNDLLEHEWHHTSKMFNKTDFWKPTIMGLAYLKKIGNSQAIAELRQMARERLADRLQPRLYKRQGWKEKVLELFPQSWGIAVVNAAAKTNRLWENQPALTPQYCQAIRSKIDELGYPSDVSRRAGRGQLEHVLLAFFQS